MTNKLLFAAVLAAPALAVAAPAQAQAVGGIATVDPTVAIVSTSAFTNASKQIDDSFKDNIAKINAKRPERQKVLMQLDKNGDKNVDDDELAAAESSKNPALAQLNQIDNDTNQLSVPIVRAQAFVVDMILQQYGKARDSVIASKKIGAILRPDAFYYASPTTDITKDITTALNGLIPSTPITPPSGWNPSEEAMQILQTLSQMQRYVAAQQGAAGPAPAGAKPAAGPAPAPAAGGKPAPAKPVTR